MSYTPRQVWSKDENEVLDNRLVWSSRLEAGENILTSVWEVTDIALDDVDPLMLVFTPQGAYINNGGAGLGGYYSTQFTAHNGEEPRTYHVKNTITTDIGRTLVQTIPYKCKRK